MEALLAEYAARAAPLRAFDAAGKGAKQQRSKLRLSHGQYLAGVTVQALTALREAPPEKKDSGDKNAEPPLLACAREAAEWVVWLGAFRAPESHKLCHNVAARCAALKLHRQAAHLSAVIVRSLSEKKSGGAAVPPPPSAAAAQAPWLLEGLRGPPRQRRFLSCGSE